MLSPPAGPANEHSTFSASDWAEHNLKARNLANENEIYHELQYFVDAILDMVKANSLFWYVIVDQHSVEYLGDNYVKAPFTIIDFIGANIKANFCMLIVIASTTNEAIKKNFETIYEGKY